MTFQFCKIFTLLLFLRENYIIADNFVAYRSSFIIRRENYHILGQILMKLCLYRIHLKDSLQAQTID
jgi:hypothetical protein